MISIIDQINKKRELAEKIKNFYKPCGFPIVVDKESIERNSDYIRTGIYLSKEYMLVALSNLEMSESIKKIDHTCELYACRIIKLDKDKSLEKNGDRVPFATEYNIYVNSFGFDTKEQMLNFLLNWEEKYKNEFEEIARLYDEKKKKEEEFIMFAYEEENQID